mmetsp:Transcript_27523/g.49610  ORF Transcript_27523/g.49610 Transcript_27523/m.49610 type:complete len:171 (-) Transcript_27523:27-539(-)
MIMAEAKKVDYLDRYRSCCSLFLLLNIVAHVVVLATVLAIYPGDCDQPIRLWLEVLLAIYATHLFLLGFSELSAWHVNTSRLSLISISYSVIHIVMGLFAVVWFILGNIWFYSEDGSCGDFSAGYILTFVILTMYYIVLGGSLCLGVLLVVMICLGSGVTTQSSAQYQAI